MSGYMLLEETQDSQPWFPDTQLLEPCEGEAMMASEDTHVETQPLEPSQGEAMMTSEDTQKPISVLLHEAAGLAEDLEKTAAQGAEALMSVASALGMSDDSDEGRTVTEGRTLVEVGTKHLEELKSISQWCENCSKHLLHVEARLMEHEFLAHEVVRQVRQLLTRHRPYPRPDWGYLVRNCLDLSVRTLRNMAKYYLRGGDEEYVEEFIGKAMVVVRLFFEESWRRHLCEVSESGVQGALLRSRICSLAAQMKRFEEDTLLEAASHAGVWWSWSHAAVVKISNKVAEGVPTSIEDCPSWRGAKNSGVFRHEAFSLMTVRVNPAEVVVSKREVQAWAEKNYGRPLEDWEIERIEGTEGSSPFEAIFMKPVLRSMATSDPDL